MATYNVTRVKHATLAASTVDTVNLSHPDVKVNVFNRGSSDIYVTLDGTTPTVAGDNTFIVPANTARRFGLGVYAVAAVKLISASTPPYTVESLG